MKKRLSSWMSGGGRLGLVMDRDLTRLGLPRILLVSIGVPVLLGAIVALWILADTRSKDILVTMGIFAVMTVGYQIFVGATGIVSFGHVAFAGIGAYVAGILTVPVVLKEMTLPDLPVWLQQTEVGLLVSILAAAGVAAVFALLVGLIVLRLNGIGAGIATLAVLVITNEVLRNADAFTRGTQTFYGVPARSGVFAVFATLTVVVAIAIWYKFSTWGLRARAVRDDSLAAETAGLNVVRSRLLPWVISAAVTGAGGALWAQLLTGFSPKTFYLAAAVPIIVMAILGGVNSVTGVIVGTVLMTIVQEVMRRVEGGGFLGLPPLSGIAQASVGIVLILVLWKWRDGLFGGLELEARRRNRSGGTVVPKESGGLGQ